MTISIRPAQPADASLVLDLIRGLAQYERLEHELVASSEQIEEALFADAPRVFCDIAEWQGEAAGFALWYYTFSTFQGRHGIYLEDLFVRPEQRGRGFGKALLRHVAARCVTEGLGRFEWSVLDWNAPSIAFYEAQGARLMGDWKRCRVDGEALAALGSGLHRERASA